MKSGALMMDQRIRVNIILTALRAVVWLAVCPLPAVFGAPVELQDQSPAEITQCAPDTYLVDFGKVAFGNVRLIPPRGTEGALTVHFGETLKDGRVDRNPPGTVRYSRAVVELHGETPVVAAPPPDKRNTETDNPHHPPAILTPAEWGTVLPFRWVEIEGWPGEFRPDQVVRQAAFSSRWDDSAASFESSDEMLNRIWELCRYSIKATTFAGLYVDGDRERIPYEADAYLNQLSHYCTDNDIQMARDTFDHLMKHSTWPSEWAPHMVFMAYADYMHTGDLKWLKPRYEGLKSKLLLGRIAKDGLVESNAKQIKKGDIVDWPKGERDGYVFTKRNTVVNAFHLRAVTFMAELARALGKETEAAEYGSKVMFSRRKFQKVFFDTTTGLYKDGIGTDHSSLHANLFPLAFELVPENQRSDVAAWLAGRGMRCSVYAAQYLLEALFENGQDAAALELIAAPGDRSWRHMVESGATITWEAWDLKYKPNQDWNHAWGAAPANLIPRYVLGVRPLEPGWKSAVVSPKPGNLSFARGKVPTPRGAVSAEWRNENGFSLVLDLPPGMTAKVDLPAAAGSTGVFCAGRRLDARRVGGRWVVSGAVAGHVELDVR